MGFIFISFLSLKFLGLRLSFLTKPLQHHLCLRLAGIKWKDQQSSFHYNFTCKSDAKKMAELVKVTF